MYEYKSHNSFLQHDTTSNLYWLLGTLPSHQNTQTTTYDHTGLTDV